MPIFDREWGKSHSPKSENSPSKPELPFEVDFAFSQIAKNVLESIIEKPKSVVKETGRKTKKKLLTEIEEHPKVTSAIIKKLVEITPSNFDSEYIDEIVLALSEKRQVVLMGPHWSTVDPVCFIKLIFEINRRIKEIAEANGQSTDEIDEVGAIVPASSKFFDHRMGETAIVASFDNFGLHFVQVVQVQDEEARATMTNDEIQIINVRAWRTILRSMRAGNILGIFPQGTRSVSSGVGRVPEDVNQALMKFIKPDALIVPMATMSYDFLPKGKKFPNLRRWPKIEMGKPLRMSDAIQIAELIECDPSDVAQVIILACKAQKYWGELASPIKKYLQLRDETN